MLTKGLKFAEKPDGPFKSLKKVHIVLLSALLRVQLAAGSMYFPFGFGMGCSSGLMPSSCRSSHALRVSFAFPFISSNTPMRLSHTFFSTCITSIACLTSKSFQ